MSGNSFSFGKPAEEAKPASSGFSFGGSKPAEEAKPASSGFAFGGSKPAEEAKPASSGFAFGGSKPTEEAKPASSGFAFGGSKPTEEAKPASSGFSFRGSKPADLEEEDEEEETWEDGSEGFEEGEPSGEQSSFESEEGNDNTAAENAEEAEGDDEEEEWEDESALYEEGEVSDDEEEEEANTQYAPPTLQRKPATEPIVAEDEDSSCVEILDISDDDDVAVVRPQMTTTTTSSTFSATTSRVEQPIVSTQRQVTSISPQTQYQPTTHSLTHSTSASTGVMPAPSSRVVVQCAETACETDPMALVDTWRPLAEVSESSLSSTILRAVSRIDALVANMRTSVDVNNRLGTPPGTPKMLGDSRRSAVDEADEAIADMTACGALSPISHFAEAPHQPSFSPLTVKSEPAPTQHFFTEFPQSSVTSQYLTGITTLSNQLLALQQVIVNSTALTATSVEATAAASSAAAATAAVGSTVYQGKSVREWKDMAESFQADVLRSREILKSEAVPSVSVIHRELIEKRSHVRELLAREAAFGNDLARLESDLFKSKIDNVSKMDELKSAMSRFHIAEAQICALTSQVSAYLQDVRRRSLMQSAELTEWRKSSAGSHGSSTILHITDKHIDDATTEGGEGTDVSNTRILSELKSLRSTLSGAQSGLQCTVDSLFDDVACLKMFSKAMGDGDAAAATTTFSSIASPLATRPLASSPTGKTPARPVSFSRMSQQQPLPVQFEAPTATTGNTASKLMQSLQAKVMALEKENAELKERASRDVVTTDPSPTKAGAAQQASSQPNTPRGLRIQTPGSTLTALDLPSTGMFDSRVDVAALGVAWSSGARVLFPLLRAAAESLGWTASLEGSGVNDTPLFGASRSRTSAAGSIDTPSVVFTLNSSTTTPSTSSSSTRILQVSALVSQFAGEVKDSNFMVERDIGGSTSKVGDTMTGSELFAALVEGSKIERQRAERAAMPTPQPLQPCPAPMSVSPFAKSAFATTTSSTTTTTTTTTAPTVMITPSGIDEMDDDAPAIVTSSRVTAPPATPLSLQGSQVTTPTSKKAGGGRTFQVMARSASPEWIRKGIEGGDEEEEAVVDAPPTQQQPQSATSKSSSQQQHQPVVLGIKRIREGGEVDSVISDDAMSKVVETGSSHVGQDRQISATPSEVPEGVQDTKTDDGDDAQSSSLTTPVAELEGVAAEPATLAHQDNSQKEELEVPTTTAPQANDQVAAEEDEEAADEEEGDMFDVENPWA